MFPLSAEPYLLICGSFETIIIAQTEWHVTRITTKTEFTVMLLTVPNKQCDPLLMPSESGTKPTYENLKVFCLEKKFVLAM